MRRGVDAGVDAQPDPARPAGQERVEGTEGLRVDEGAAAERVAQVRIGLADAIDDDPVGRCAGADGERQLDRTHDLESEAVRREPSQQSAGRGWP